METFKLVMFSMGLCWVVYTAGRLMDQFGDFLVRKAVDLVLPRPPKPPTDG